MCERCRDDHNTSKRLLYHKNKDNEPSSKKSKVEAQMFDKIISWLCIIQLEDLFDYLFYTSNSMYMYIPRVYISVYIYLYIDRPSEKEGKENLRGRAAWLCIELLQGGAAMKKIESK